MLHTGELIRDGKSKRVYATDDPDYAVIYFKDEAMAFHGLKRGRILGKGEVNNAVCKTFFGLLSQHGVPNHYVEQLDSRQSLIRRCEMLPVAVKVRNRAAGTLCERLGVEEGRKMSPPVVEFRIRDDYLEDPLVNMTHIMAMRYATQPEIDTVTQMALRVNEIIGNYMREIGIELIDFRLEFGRFHGQIMVCDEISPDVARFWDVRTGERLDIDRFRRDLGNAEQAYQELLHRMMGLEE